MNKLKHYILNVHITNHYKLGFINRIIAENYIAYGNSYYDTLDFAFMSRYREICRFKHVITLKIIRLWQ